MHKNVVLVVRTHVHNILGCVTLLGVLSEINIGNLISNLLAKGQAHPTSSVSALLMQSLQEHISSQAWTCVSIPNLVLNAILWNGACRYSHT